MKFGAVTADGKRNAPTPDQITAAASRLAFAQPIIQDNLRALVVEVMVDYALKPEWRHCAGDWKGWDFEHIDGTRLEVKQSALLQIWAAPKSKSLPRFDIKERTGYWDNRNIWVVQHGRYAQIYVFAYHPIGGELADQRDPRQWQFHVVKASTLPVARTIALSKLRALSEKLHWDALFGAVERERRQLVAGDYDSVSERV